MSDFSFNALDVLHESGFFSHLDYYFSTTMANIFNDAEPLEIISAALTCRALSKGCICLDLTGLAGSVLESSEGKELIRLPELKSWCNILENSAMVGMEVSNCGKKETDTTSWIAKYPLILDRDNNLYLSRYYDFQCRLSDNIKARIKSRISGPDDEFVDHRPASYFDSRDTQRTFGQQQAVKKALCSGFIMVSGGPGTGKTYITDIIQTLLITWANENDLKPPRVICLAPTGKAAARLKNGATIHSALKPVKNGTGFRHNAANPLAADLVIIDEASMIDMALMTRLFEAISPDARIVMLGDMNQLSPVQAGAVFFDLCHADVLSDYRVFLDVNFRSGGKSALKSLQKRLMPVMRILWQISLKRIILILYLWIPTKIKDIRPALNLLSWKATRRFGMRHLVTRPWLSLTAFGYCALIIQETAEHYKLIIYVKKYYDLKAKML